MELAEIAKVVQEMAHAHVGELRWMLPSGVPETSVSWDNSRKTIDGTRWAAARVPVVHYTDNGYAIATEVHVPINVGDDGIIGMAELDEKIGTRLAGTIARSEKLGHGPARYDEMDPDISHLKVDPVFSNHLNARYGSDAPRIARRLVGRTLRREHPRLKKGLPKGSEMIDEKATVSSLIISGTVELGTGVSWKSGVLVISDMLISETVASALRGSPISSVVRHEVLADHAILDITSAPRTSEVGGGTTTMKIDMPAVPVLEVWPFTN